MTVYEAVFLASRIIVENKCRESITISLAAMIHVMLKKVSVAVDGGEAVKENRDLSKFAATSQNPWCFIYSSYMDNAYEEEENSGSIFDDINQGEVFGWEEEVEDGKVFDEYRDETRVYKMEVDNEQHPLEQLKSYNQYIDLKPPKKPTRMKIEEPEEKLAN
ncbi:hypothetical protein CU098_012951 [Rhizopus stolonifer]|uniref:Uncharacterized protein n=1 Tax=Rhizopus stolonifer TaxID=4846 RepID=A0A367KS39_RHIST|nr:hypothetical protein CU098_012951 [Rhizopus stolonifer]